MNKETFYRLFDKKHNLLVCSSFNKKRFLELATKAMQETKGKVYSKDCVTYYLVR